MPYYSLNELMHLTCDELCNLALTIENVLPNLEAGTVERLNALTSLRNIRRAMTLRGCPR
jgi:hypothetical protein